MQVLQRAPQAAVVWGFTAPGATVTTRMSSGNSAETRNFTTVAAADGTWRQTLPPTPASDTAYDFAFSSTTSESAAMTNVLFGDVYICGGK